MELEVQLELDPVMVLGKVQDLVLELTKDKVLVLALVLVLL